jgi:hypothetical protein
MVGNAAKKAKALLEKKQKAECLERIVVDGSEPKVQPVEETKAQEPYQTVWEKKHVRVLWMGWMMQQEEQDQKRTYQHLHEQQNWDWKHTVQRKVKYEEVQQIGKLAEQQPQPLWLRLE